MMKIRGKKGVDALKLLAGAILIFVVLALMLTFVPRFLKGSISGAQLSSCMSTHDLDSDEIKVGDNCPCDTGKIEDQNSYAIRGYPDCIFTMKDTPIDGAVISPKDGSYILSNPALFDRCKDAVVKVGNEMLEQGNKACGASTDSVSDTSGKILNDGISYPCAGGLAPKEADKSTPKKVCPTSGAKCEQMFKDSPVCKNEGK